MKNDPLYKYYLEYINYRTNIGMLSRSQYYLMKMSRSAFDAFKKKYDDDKTFGVKISEVYRPENRNKKINDILDDDLFDL